MNFFDIFTHVGVNVGVAEFRTKPNALLVDVRPAAAYAAGHIPGSINIPWSDMGRMMKICPDTSTPIYIYCKNGNYSRQAVTLLKKLGYKDLTNIGGINRYQGDLET